MWELDHKEGWVPKNWCFWTVVLEKTLESPLDCKEIQPVHPKGNQSWIFIGRTDVETEAPILWLPNAKSWLIRKGPGAGKDWRQEEKGMTEDKDGWMASLTQWTWVWASSGRCWRTEKPGWAAVHGVAKNQSRLSDWTTMTADQGGVRTIKCLQALIFTCISGPLACRTPRGTWSLHCFPFEDHHHEQRTPYFWLHESAECWKHPVHSSLGPHWRLHGFVF